MTIARILALSALLLLGLSLPPLTRPAAAGCGCDHPPPAWTPVAPSFASPGMAIRLHTDGFEFEVGSDYSVSFVPTKGSGVSLDVTAVDSRFLELVTPELRPGPVSLSVSGAGVDHVYESGLFTALPAPPVIPNDEGVFYLEDFETAVTEDGTLLLPFNVRHLLDAHQLAFQLSDLPLEFGHDDAIFYNIDGFDLTLFTLDVDDPTERQWGSYRGWKVEEDTQIFSTVYEDKVAKSKNPALQSDLLTYWRHEYRSYAAAHMTGASHEVDAQGLHPDGTRHVNHGHLILAIAGLRRSANDPLDPAQMHPLTPGAIRVDVRVATVAADNPVEPDQIALGLEEQPEVETLGTPEDHFDEFADLELE